MNTCTQRNSKHHKPWQIAGTQPHAAIRNWRERLIQTLWFEALGVVIVSPAFAHFTGASTPESLMVLIVLSAAMIGWSAFYNSVFDLIEYCCAGRVASDRPHGWRVLHTLAHEATAVIVTWPLIVALTPLGWHEALVADIGLTLTYSVYGYFFHLGFDRLRPIFANRTPINTRRTRQSEASRRLSLVVRGEARVRDVVNPFTDLSLIGS